MLQQLLSARAARGPLRGASRYAASVVAAGGPVPTKLLRLLPRAPVAAAALTTRRLASPAATLPAAERRRSAAELDCCCSCGTSLLAHRPHPRLPFAALYLQSQRAYLTLSENRLAVKEFKLADIGEGIAQVELLKWYKNVGDTVDEMEDVCEVQSDKAAVQISSRFSGKVVKLRHQVGDFVRVGSPLMDIEVDEDEASPSHEHPQQQDAEEQRQEPQYPAAAAGDETGAATREGSSNSNVAAAPATRRLAREKGVDLSCVRGTGRNGIITKDDVLNYLRTADQGSGGPAAAASRPSHLQGEGATPPLGADADAAARAGTHEQQPQHHVHQRPLPSGDRTGQRETKKVLLRGFSRAMVKTMNESVKVPQLLVAESFDVTDLMTMRKRLAAATQGQVKPTITAFFLKAISLALDAHPILNSKFDAASGDSYEQFGSHNISVAIDTPNGLVVPNVKDVQDRSIVEIQAELHRLQKLAKENRLSPKDLTGGTISLSNVGAIAGTLVHALLFDGQASIIGLGRAVDTPVFCADSSSSAFGGAAAGGGSPAADGGLLLEKRSVVTCSCTADHRHCDGATVARFMKRMKELIEEPAMMLIQLR